MTTSVSESAASLRPTDQPDQEAAVPNGVLASRQLREAFANEWIVTTGPYRIPPGTVQPASLDLTLGPEAWPLRCSFLPDAETSVEEKAQDLRFEGIEPIDLRDGAMLERNRPYLVPLVEELRLPVHIRAKANPKSSTGRLDVFTRVITDRNHRFDEIGWGYRGKLYLEVVPRSFAVKVQTGLALNQLRLIAGTGTRVSDDDLRATHLEFPLLYAGGHAVPSSDLPVNEGLFLSLDLAGAPGRLVGYRAKKGSRAIDMSQIRTYSWQDFWEPVYTEAKQRIVLEPEDFYLLISAEAVSIPPHFASEMLAYDPTAGELRTHYAGFFDPGFGFSRSNKKKDRGSRAALEVRARDVAFMVEHQQPVCKLAFEHMAEEPEVLYGEDLGSNYQGQVSMLSKHFTEQTAGEAQMALTPTSQTRRSPDVLFKS